MTHRAAFLVPPAHHSALCKNVAKSCICHRSAKSACKSFICHTSKKAFLQALCLPHLRHPSGGARSSFLLNLKRRSRLRTPVQHTCPPTLVPCIYRRRVREFFGFASSRITGCQSCFSIFQIVQRRRRLLFSSRLSRTKSALLY